MSLSERIKEGIKETSVTSSIIGIASSIPIVFLWGFPDIGNQLISLLLVLLSPKSLLTLLYISFAAILILLTFIRSYKNKINELTEFTAKDGIYEDNQGNAYCVKEKHLMSKHYQNVYMKNSYYCVACKQLYELPNNENNTDADIVKPVSTGIYF